MKEPTQKLSQPKKDLLISATTIEDVEKAQEYDDELSMNPAERDRIESERQKPRIVETELTLKNTEDQQQQEEQPKTNKRKQKVKRV